MSDEAYLAERYGRTSPTARRWGLVALVAAGAVALAVALWVAVVFARVPVRWDDVGYRIGTDEVEVTFDVVMAPGTRASCRVQALDQSYGQVGVVDVEVGPSELRATRHVVTVPIVQEAVTGHVDTCTKIKD